MMPRLLIVALLVIFCAVTARAGFEGPMRFFVYIPCTGNSSRCAASILAEGLIERDTPRKFLEFLANLAKHPHDGPGPSVIAFDSPGGDLFGALELGRIIRQLEFSTRLESEYVKAVRDPSGFHEESFRQGVVCSSACAFAFMGGVNRLVEDSARFGIHQFSGRSSAVGDSATQVTVVLLAAFLKEMGISRTLLDLASLVPPTDLYWLSISEMHELGVENMAPRSGKWELGALSDGSVVASIDQTQPGTQSRVVLLVLTQTNLPYLFISYRPGDTSRANMVSALEALGQNPLSLAVDGRDIATYSSVEWKNIRGLELTARLPLPSSSLVALQTGEELELRVFIPHVFEQYDPSMTFPLTGLDKLLLAVLKCPNYDSI